MEVINTLDTRYHSRFCVNYNELLCKNLWKRISNRKTEKLIKELQNEESI